MRELLRVLVLIAALSIVALGSPLGVVGATLSLQSGGYDVALTVTLSVSILVLSLSFGLALAWHAWRAIQGHPSGPFRPRRSWLLLLLFLLALVLGQVVLSSSILPVLTFPLLHIAACVLPALFIVAVVGQALRGVITWRELVLQISGGVFLAAPLAFVLEVTAILLIATAALAGLTLQPDGQELVRAVTSYLQDPAWLLDPSALAPALLTPVVVAAAVALVAGLVPLIEEAIKTLGAGLMSYRQPSLPQAVLWGLAAGAGFSIAEGLLNSVGGLEAWLPTVLLRIGTTLLHCLTGMLMGLAWFQITRRRWARALSLYLLSVAIHGLWNGLTTIMVLLSLTAIGTGADSGSQLAIAIGTLAILSGLVVLGLGMTAGLAGLTAYARRQAATPAIPSKEQAESSSSRIVSPASLETEE